MFKSGIISASKSTQFSFIFFIVNLHRKRALRDNSLCILLHPWWWLSLNVTSIKNLNDISRKRSDNLHFLPMLCCARQYLLWIWITSGRSFPKQKHLRWGQIMKFPEWTVEWVYISISHFNGKFILSSKFPSQRKREVSVQQFQSTHAAPLACRRRFFLDTENDSVLQWASEYQPSLWPMLGGDSHAQCGIEWFHRKHCNVLLFIFLCLEKPNDFLCALSDQFKHCTERQLTICCKLIHLERVVRVRPVNLLLV